MAELKPSSSGDESLSPRSGPQYGPWLFGLLALALGTTSAWAANPTYGEVEGPNESRLSATVLGALEPGARAKVAIKWTGALGELVTAWYDADGDGSFGDHEVVISEQALKESMTVLEFEVPRWADAGRPGQVRILAHDSGAEAIATASAGACAFSSEFQLAGLDATVYSFAVYDDGGGSALYVGGVFTVAGGVAANRIAKWNGTTWSALGSPTNGVGGGAFVYALAVYDDGSGSALYAGGDFTTAGGVAASRIAKWNGTTWSALGSPTNGVNAEVRALAVYDDGSGPALFVAGSFTTAGGATANRIAKWKGGSWSAVGSPTNGFELEAYALVVHNDGGGAALYAGGAFTTAGGVSANRIAKWNGAIWSPLGSGATSSVRALAVFNDGGGAALYAGGEFTSIGGVSANRIAKWNGAAWSVLGSATNGVNSAVRALAVFDDGGGAALFVGGDFTLAAGASANRMAKWTGTSWSALGSPTNGVGSNVRALAVYGGGGTALYAGGDLLSAGSGAANRIAKWNGASWSPLGLGQAMGADVRALAVYDDGSGPALYAGGDFTSAGSVVANRIARWNGTTWSALGSPTNGINNQVSALAVYDDGSGPALYAGGFFSNAGGVTASGIAKWNGTSWSALGSPTEGVNGAVNALAVYDDGSGPALYAGGDFSSAGGVAANRVAKWNGTSWSALGVGVSGGFVYALAAYDDGGGSKLYVGGGFTSAGGASADFIAKWNGATWSTVGGAFALNGAVRALATYDDGGGLDLYVGGFFSVFNGAQYIARWNGTAWSTVGTNNGMNWNVVALAVGDFGSGPALYAGGYFTTAGSVAANRIAKWDGTSWSVLGSPTNGTNNFVFALATYDDGTGPALYAGGLFTFAGGSGSSRIAKWQCSCDCSYSLPSTQWRMVSLPCKPSTSTVSAVFGDDLLPADYGTRWIVYERDEVANSYVALGLGSSLSQGTGYWIKSLDAGLLSATGSLTPTICPVSSRYSSCFDIPLHGTGTGVQNLSGHAFSPLVDWSDVRFVDGSGTERTLSEAQADGIASRIMYKWTGGAYEPFDGETPGMEGSLGEWNGIWVKAYQDTTLRIPSPAAIAGGEALFRPVETAKPTGKSSGDSSSVDGTDGVVELAEPISLSGWYIRVTAAGGGLLDRGNVLGQLTDADDGPDARDLPELAPFSAPYLTVVFPHPEWGGAVQQYASDYHAFTRIGGGTWTFEVRSDDPGRKVTLAFEGPPHLLARTTLIDLATGGRVSLKTPTYLFEMTAATRAFRVEVSPR